MRAFAVLLAAFAAAFAFRSPEARIAPLIDEFDGFVQQRLAEPLPDALGMSRIMRPSSFGRHFTPAKFATKDFSPRSEAERKLVSELESRKVEFGMYVFGESVLRTAPAAYSFRSLKGPGIVTAGTPRGGDFPAWKTVYPVAREAMTAFAKGDRHFDAQIGSWTISARPAAAGLNCLGCHNYDPAFKRETKFEQGDVLGGAIYVYRSTP